MTKQQSDAVQGVIFLIGLYEGVLPLVVRGLFHRRPFLSWPAHLDAPAWWIVSLVVCAVAFAGLVLVDRITDSKA